MTVFRSLLVMGMVVLSIATPRGARAQTLRISSSTGFSDTLATVADLSGTSTTFRRPVTVSISGCTNGTGTTCRVYVAGRAKSGFGSVSGLRWSASADCSAATAVLAGATPAGTGTGFVYSVTESGGTGTSGSRTVWFCYEATLTWSSAPQQFLYELYFRLARG